jgi:hypothetical protein
LRATSFKTLSQELENSDLLFAVITEVETAKQLSFFEEERPEVDFLNGDIDDLVEALKRSYEQLIKESLLEKAVTRIEESISLFNISIGSQPATTARFAQIIGIGDAQCDEEELD